MSTERVTLDDVAADAGVHAATVSRAISRPDLVGEETLARVNAAIERLGYVPNRAARQLASGRTSMVAVLVPDIANPFFSGLVQALQRHAAEAGLLTVLADTSLDPATEREVVASLAPSVDGLLVCAPVGATDELTEVAADRPLVFVNRRARSVPWAIVDQRRITRLAVEHLRDLGHEHIAVVAGPAGFWSSTERAAEIAASGLDLTVLGPVDPTHRGGESLIDDVVASGVTAVVAFNDVMAIGLIGAARRQGIDVPGDLSVVGSDDIPMAAMATPPLTTIGAPLDELGAAALHSLTAAVVGEGTHDKSLEPYLVERSTTAPPRKASTP